MNRVVHGFPGGQDILVAPTSATRSMAPDEVVPTVATVMSSSNLRERSTVTYTHSERRDGTLGLGLLSQQL